MKGGRGWPIDTQSVTVNVIDPSPTVMWLICCWQVVSNSLVFSTRSFWGPLNIVKACPSVLFRVSDVWFKCSPCELRRIM